MIHWHIEWEMTTLPDDKSIVKPALQDELDAQNDFLDEVNSAKREGFYVMNVVATGAPELIQYAAFRRWADREYATLKLWKIDREPADCRVCKRVAPDYRSHA